MRFLPHGNPSQERFASYISLDEACRNSFLSLVRVFKPLRRWRVIFPEEKFAQVARDCVGIRTLPCSSQVRAHIIAAKVVPQLAFAPQLIFLPKKKLEKVQIAIAETLWKDRPYWRSKALLLSIVFKSHRAEPFIARAYTSILECARFFKRNRSARDKWSELFYRDNLMPSSLMQHFAQACAIFSITWEDAFTISCFGSSPFSFVGIAQKDLRYLLQQLAAHGCYVTAGRTHRKDFKLPVGFLDLKLTRSALKVIDKIPNEPFSMRLHWESAITGCTITNDRLAASKLVESNLCRFCNEEKESLAHFAFERCGLPSSLSRPTARHDHGPNFHMLGIVKYLGSKSLIGLSFLAWSTFCVSYGWNHFPHFVISGLMAR